MKFPFELKTDSWAGFRVFRFLPVKQDGWNQPQKASLVTVLWVFLADRDDEENTNWESIMLMGGLSWAWLGWNIGSTIITRSSLQSCQVIHPGRHWYCLLHKAKRLSNVDKIVNKYEDRHRKECHDFVNKEKVTMFEHRTSLRKLIDVNKNLHSSQIKVIELMGFGSLTKVQLDQIDKVTLKWFIERYDPESSCFSIESQRYVISDVDVRNALGVPATGQDITLDTTSTEGLEKYRHIFKIVDGRIDIVALLEKLQSCTSTDTEFKLMYLVLLFGTVLFPSYSQKFPVHYLNLLVAVENIVDLNWAGLIRNTLNDGIRKWKNKEGTYISGCLLFFQVFYLAIVRPQNSPFVLNLTTERPFLAFLTKQRINFLTADVQKDSRYLREQANFFGFDDMSMSTNSMDNTTTRRVVPDVLIDEHDDKVIDSNGIRDDFVNGDSPSEQRRSVSGHCREKANFFGFDDMSMPTNSMDKTTARRVVHDVNEDSPSEQRRSVNKQGGDCRVSGLFKSNEVKDPHVPKENVQEDSYIRTQLSVLSARLSRIEKQKNYVCEAIGNPHVTQQIENVRDDLHTREQLSLLSARVSSIEKQKYCVRDDFGSRTQFSLLSARVSSSEKQVAQLMSTMDELVNRHVNGDRFGYQTSIQESFDKIDSVLQELHNLKSKIPLIIRNTLLGISQSTSNTPISSNINVAGDDTDDSMLRKKRENSVIVIPDNEQPLTPKRESVPPNPLTTTDDVLLEYLFNPNMDSSTWVVNFGRLGCSRSTLKCLEPGKFLVADVIDCVAYMCTRSTTEDPRYHDRWCFPTMFAQVISMKHYADEKIINMLHYCKSRIEDCAQIYLPIHDGDRHWYLAIIDLDSGTVSICDSAPVSGMREYRKKIVNNAIVRMEKVLKKWQPEKYKIKNITNKFYYMDPDWVPLQPNGFDCGVYVCMMMMFEMGAFELSEEQSDIFRQQIAINLYRSNYNMFASPR